MKFLMAIGASALTLGGMKSLTDSWGEAALYSWPLIILFMILGGAPKN